jgi:hypothetical protein
VSDADDLLSSTYDNLHGLLMKKSDIEICRWVLQQADSCFLVVW